ncbi:MAG: NAD-dependent epimerase/dehydratase family protein [Ferruginibacter sp.]
MMVNNTIILEDLQNIIAADLPWQNLYGKTILVTGANGFLPAYMVQALLLLNKKNVNHKIKIIGLVRNIEKAKKRFDAYSDSGNFSLVSADISKPIQIDEKIDFIIHAASQASPKYYGTDPVGTLSANTIGTFHLLNLAVENSVEKFLYFSSSEVYGAVSNIDSIGESSYGVLDPTQVRSCYAESKRMGETMCVSFAAQYKVPVSIARPFHTYGPGLSLDDGRVFADFVSNIVRGEDIMMNSDGGAIRSFCYLADATIGFFTVLLKGENSMAYNVGNPGGTVSIKELAKLLVNLYPQKKLKAVFKDPDSATYLRSNLSRLCPDIDKIRVLGWQPVTNLEEGFKRTIDSFIV